MNVQMGSWRGLMVLWGIFIGSASFGQGIPAFYEHNKQAWVDSVFQTLTPDERLAQLFMVPAYSNRDTAHVNGLERLIRKHKIGGLLFFQGGPVRQAIMCNKLQATSKLPMMVAMDAEWGIGMRLDSTIDYPRQMTLGAIQDDRLIYDFGVEVARQMKRMGMHINFAPVVDVNSNPDNPVIGTRSFGENKYNVAKKGSAYMRGMQDNRILACAKHFPGHGDTDADSHYALPLVKHSMQRLDTLELYPFRELIEEGIGSIMVAHLAIPALDTTPDLASTLSPNVVNGLLKDSLGFEGIVFTDALNMKSVSKFFAPGEVDLYAFLAGNDVMEYTENVELAIQKIRSAVDSGLVSQAEIDKRCLKVLNLKAWAGLDNYLPIELKNLSAELNNSQARAVHERLVTNSLTLLINKNKMIPLKELESTRIASLVVGGDLGGIFQRSLSKYAPIDHYAIKAETPDSVLIPLVERLNSYGTVIVSIHDLNSNRASNYGVAQRHLDLIDRLNDQIDLIVNLFGNPYALGRIPGFEKVEALLFSFERDEASERLAAQAIFGGIGVSGKLPITANRLFRLGQGLNTQAFRLAYGEPAQTGLDEKVLAGIDAIIGDAIAKKATPGAQILIAKDGMVVYERSFGHHTYEAIRPVNENDVYDLASITKIAASLVSFMKLVDDNKLNVDDKVSEHLRHLKFSNKKKITFRDMLAHYARLQAWIPFYKKTIKHGGADSLYYRTVQSEEFPHQVAQNLYMRADYPDSMYHQIDESQLLEEAVYKYSDLGYYYIKEVIEKKTKQNLEDMTTEEFYAPLGLQTMGFYPRDRIELDRLVPTEYDMTFRKQLIQGDVHDPGAAMLGGVGGHAGLFSNANDLAILMQMLLNKGEYGGKRYLSQETIEEFTKCQFCKDGNRRGIGFDKPEPDGKGGSTCDCVSYLSFGHTGFTGTMAWADPEKNIVYIFLSNRVYPDAENDKLLKMNVRTRIQEVIYNSLSQ